MCNPTLDLIWPNQVSKGTCVYGTPWKFRVLHSLGTRHDYWLLMMERVHSLIEVRMVVWYTVALIQCRNVFCFLYFCFAFHPCDAESGVNVGKIDCRTGRFSTDESCIK